jgi:hypothetical protein
VTHGICFYLMYICTFFCAALVRSSLVHTCASRRVLSVLLCRSSSSMPLCTMSDTRREQSRVGDEPIVPIVTTLRTFLLDTVMRRILSPRYGLGLIAQCVGAAGTNLFGQQSIFWTVDIMDHGNGIVFVVIVMIATVAVRWTNSPSSAGCDRAIERSIDRSIVTTPFCVCLLPDATVRKVRRHSTS